MYEYRLRVAPVVAGGGKRLFAEGGGTKAMRLVTTRTFDTGSSASPIGR